MTHDTHLTQFISYLRAERHYSERTLAYYEPVLRGFVAFVAERAEWVGWQCVQADDIREWIVAQMEQGIMPQTVNKNLSAMRSLYRFLLREGVVSADPTRKVVGPKKEKRLPEFVRESDMNRLFDRTFFGDDFSGVRDRLVMLLFYTTGVRRSELAGLDVESVDFYASTIKVLGKRNKERVIPFGPELKEALVEYLELRRQVVEGRGEEGAARAGSALVLGNTGRRISYAQEGEIVKRYLSQVTTLRRCSPHVLRHSFATAMLNNGAEIEVVKELLGHESIATTEIYTHTTFEELKKVYGQAHPRGDDLP